MKMEFIVNGMKCDGCVNRIKNVLSSIKGIKAYDISLENKRLVVDVKKEKVINEVIKKVEALGFTLEKC